MLERAGNVGDRACDSAVTAAIKSARNKFLEYLPILTGKGDILLSFVVQGGQIRQS